MSEWTAERIRSFRTKYRLSQAKLAELTGVTENYIYLLEKEVKTPSRTLQLLLDYIERDYEARN
jgi:transcriptional regulator with XRE-family HTH domain